MRSKRKLNGIQQHTTRFYLILKKTYLKQILLIEYADGAALVRPHGGGRHHPATITASFGLLIFFYSPFTVEFKMDLCPFYVRINKIGKHIHSDTRSPAANSFEFIPLHNH